MQVTVTEKRELVKGDVVLLSSGECFLNDVAEVIAVTSLCIVVLVKGYTIPVILNHAGVRLALPKSGGYDKTSEIFTVELA